MRRKRSAAQETSWWCWGNGLVFESCSGFDWRADSDDESDRLVEGTCRGLFFVHFHDFSLEVLCKIAETLSDESVCGSKFKPGTSRIRKNANHSAVKFLVQTDWMLLCHNCCAVLIMPATNQRCLSQRQTISPATFSTCSSKDMECLLICQQRMFFLRVTTVCLLWASLTRSQSK